MSDSPIRLTQYSHGAGCGCKIAPAVLSEILGDLPKQMTDPRLLVGNDDRDDAAVYQINDREAVVSTTDFFMPIVDDAFDFGGIASVNAISDIYAMGARPVVAIAILGWPLDKLPASVAGEVLKGARDACSRAGIPLAGGHSIDAPEPIFGLAVTGLVPVEHVRSNNLAKPGDELYLTKPLGIGILTTAQKRGLIANPDFREVTNLMLQLNDIGPELATGGIARSITDVTGFGLLGHLIEMCEASNVHAEIELGQVPRLSGVAELLAQNCFPGGTDRNFASYGSKVSPLQEEAKRILCDPQTSGGLLIAAAPEQQKDLQQLARSKGLELTPFGRMTAAGNYRVIVN